MRYTSIKKGVTISTKIHASQHEKLFYLKWKNRNRPKHLAIVEWVDQLYRKVIQQGGGKSSATAIHKK